MSFKGHYLRMGACSCVNKFHQVTKTVGLSDHFFFKTSSFLTVLLMTVAMPHLALAQSSNNGTTQLDSIIVDVGGDGDGDGETTAHSPVEGYVAKRSATATKTDTPLKETPQSISVIGTEQMRDQGVQTIQEAVRYSPGVLADGFGVDSRNDYSFIRGVAAAYFVDGLRSNTISGNYTNTIQIEPYALERVEVLRGPASMLFGQATAGGIINGISKRPSDISSNEIGIEYGSFDFKQLKLDSTGKLSEDGKWLYRITGLIRDADTQVDYVENDRIMFQPAITYRPTQDTEITFIANIRDDHTGSTQQFLPMTGTLNPNVNGLKVPINAFMGEKDDYYDTQSQSATLLIDHKFNNDLKIHHATRYSHTENSYDSTYPAILSAARVSLINTRIKDQTFGFVDPFLTVPNAPFFDASQSEIARLRYLKETETDVFITETYLTGDVETGDLKHKVTGGFDFMRFSTDSKRVSLLDNLVTTSSGATPFALSVLSLPSYQPAFDIYNPTYGQSNYLLNLATFAAVDPSNITLFADPKEVQSQTGIYIQDQLRWGSWIGVVGLRHDWVDIEFEGSADVRETATTGRAGLMYEFDSGFTPYVSYTQSFTPQPGQRVSDNLYVPLNLKAATPREGEQIEVGFKYQPKGSDIVINASIYELKEDNLIVSPDTLLQTLGGASSKVRGFEIEASGNITPELKIIAAYAYTDAKWEKYPDPISIKVGTELNGAPKHLASLWGIYSFNDGFFKGLSLGAGARYVGSTNDVAQDVLTSQRISAKTPSFTLFDATVAYETDSWRWQLTGQNLADKYHVVSCSAFRGDCGVGQGRTITTGLTYKF